VRDRIADAYGIAAEVLPAPVAMTGDETAQPVPQLAAVVQPSGELEPRKFYLCVSRLLPYKNVDQVVRAFAGLDRDLVLVGRGPEAENIKALKTANVTMVSDLSDAQMAWLYQNCSAVIAASYEDYGLTPIEAGVWGRPSVVLRWGGFTDTVVEDVTGVFFDEPEPAAIVAAIDRLEHLGFDEEKIRSSMQRFTESEFSDGLHAAVTTVLKGAR
jgi:glycosyltransferase involved in cell wall biosynthesis